jgi:hypothetical protein
METLIVHPENHEQINALKAFLKAFKIKFEARQENIKKTDFSDLAGKLSWQGDALNEQKKLRGEWE